MRRVIESSMYDGRPALKYRHNIIKIKKNEANLKIDSTTKKQFI